MPRSERGRLGKSRGEPEGGVGGETEIPPQTVQRREYKARDSGSQGAAETRAPGQRNERAGLVVVAHLGRDVTLRWILSGFVGV